MRSDLVSIVIQGQLNKISLDNIENYKKHGPVIISCYYNDGALPLGGFMDGVTEVRSPMGGWFRSGNSYYHGLSTSVGLAKVQTPFAIKVRSDEFYTDISPVVAAIKQHPEKMITNNVFFKKMHKEPFHPSDHLVAGKTEYLLSAFKNLKDLHWKYGGNNTHIPGREAFGLPWLGSMSTEATIFLSFLKAKGMDLTILKDNNLELNKKIMKENVVLIPLEDLGEFMWTQRVGPQRIFITDPEPRDESIRSLDEL